MIIEAKSISDPKPWEKLSQVGEIQVQMIKKKYLPLYIHMHMFGSWTTGQG